MKAKVASLLVVILLTTTQCMAQKRITVEAQSNDISYNLDLKAVASIFGESRDLEEFEMRLNDYDSQISNLDLNNDGEVDYLRVIESSESNVHVVVIQAVLDRNVFQDVATIVVEKNRYNRTYVQIIGDPYLYGNNYVIEPSFYRTPSIFSYLWSSRYHYWNSPYYWGYYPSYYRYRNPYEVNLYLSHINSHINHRHDYRYSTYRQNVYSERLQKSISRNDYSKRYPDRTFSSRNENVRNKKEIETRRDINTRPSGSRSESGRRTEQGIERSNGSRTERNSSGTRNTSPTWNGGGTIQRNTTPSRGSGNSEIKRESNKRSIESGRKVNESVQRPSENRIERNTNTNTRPTNNRTYETRPSTNRTESTNPTIKRESNTNRVAPTVNTPRRSVESKPAERKAPESRPTTETKSEKRSRSTDSNSGRR
ncbi:MAG: hypothetical protein GZ091_00400 [Paludibacter sp.]|nr:hypothetical protein [Paludibacter sp.]